MVLPGQVRSFNWTVWAEEYFSAGFFNFVSLSLSRGGAAVNARLTPVRCRGRTEPARKLTVPSGVHTAILKEQAGDGLQERSE